jgi:WD40 repeat protein
MGRVLLLLLLVIQVWRHKKALWIDHHDTISVLAAGTDVLYSGSWDKTIKVWRLSDFKCLESVTSHIDAVNALAIDKKQGFLYSGSADTTIKVWERSMQAQHSTTTTMQKKPAAAAIMHHTLIATLEAAQKSPINALALSPDGSILYSGLSNKTIAVWKKQHGGGGGGDGNDDDELRGKQQHHHMVPAGLLKGHCLAVLCLSTIADLLISGSADKTIRVWRRSRGKDTLHSCISVMQGHKGPVKSLCTSNCSSSSSSSVSAATTRMGFLVYSGSMDCDVRVWWVPEQDREEENFSDDDDGSF